MASEQNAFARFVIRHRKGDVLFREGDEGDKLFIVQAGSVAIKKSTDGGLVQLAVMKKGDFFGEMAVLEHQPRSATAEMLEDGALVAIDSATFVEMVRSNPEIAVRMLRKYSRRLREMNALLEKGGAAPSPLGIVAEAPSATPAPAPSPAPAESAAPAPQPATPPAVAAPPPSPAPPEPVRSQPVTSEPVASRPVASGPVSPDPVIAMAPVAVVTSQAPAMKEPSPLTADAALPVNKTPVNEAAEEAAPLAFLVAKTSGHRYPVSKNEALVGRFDTVAHRSPDIDLSHEENSRNVSRRHAKVLHREGRFFLVEENGAMNGTFVNGQRITAGSEVPLADGDEVMLCRVALVFKLS